MILLPKILRTSDRQQQDEAYRDMIRAEAKIGGQLFGPVPAGHKREFFCLDKHTWVWHEEWIDAQGVPQVITTRYEFRPDSVIKVQNNQAYQSLSPSEALNLYKAVGLYVKAVAPLYGYGPVAQAA